MKSQQNTNKEYNLNINVTKDDVDVNDFLFITHEFGLRPSKLVFYSQFDAPAVWGIITDEFESTDKNINKTSEIIPDGDRFIFNNKYCVKLSDDLYLSFLELDSAEEDERVITNFTVFYNHTKVNSEELTKLIHKFDSAILAPESGSQEKNFYLRIGANGYELSPFKTQTDKENIEYYYNDDVITQANKLIKQINKLPRGLTVLWGERGTGKTNFASYITTQVEKQVIYVPSVMIDATINSPEFLTFLERNNNSIILLDDCDMFTEHQHYRLSMSINNIKQLVDGILSDHLNVHIILITNTEDSDDITNEYMDCNSIVADIQFEELDVEKANELSKFLGKNKTYKNPARVVDVVKGLKEQAPDNEIGY
jgi:predicted AAA+ superfamily ATPase